MITDYVTILVNGEAFNCLSTMSLKHILLYLDFDLDIVAVEYNGEIVSLNHLERIFVQNRDSVEIITIVGGG